MSNTLIIVESPTKAKTIGKFLGGDYTVLSSFGHIRDLPKSKIGVDTAHDFSPSYVIPPDKKPRVTELKKAAKNADAVLLATDADREGEAIAWHIAEVLGLDSAHSQRIIFHEITKHAIEEALTHPRGLDHHLIDAQQARRILDRLVGYELSPFLWEKVRRGLSAGRVQSVAMRLVVERERERKAFKVDEFWTIDAQFEKNAIIFAGKLVKTPTQTLDKLSIPNEAATREIVAALSQANFTVASVEEKRANKSPNPPHTTSSLQIDSNNKLGMSAKATMMLAQGLYETGHITYMRTDSTNLAEKFLVEVQTYLSSSLGAAYATGAKRYQTTKKGAQEAHEAIRPTDITKHPDLLKTSLEPRAWKLYDLIWRRTLASQMPAAELKRTSVDIEAKEHIFRSNGSTIVFDGFMRIYQSAKETLLPTLAIGDHVKAKTITPTQHFTEPPARYSDATLVKTLEEFGIGRPSTYAPTISTIIDRGYVERDDNKRLAPTDIAGIVSDLLVEHFPQIVDYAFTAKMENTLDEIADGTTEWIPMLKEFYVPFHASLAEKSKTLTRAEIMPERELGTDKDTGKTIRVRTGRFGPYVQLGEDLPKGSKEEKPKRASLLKSMTFETVTHEQATRLLSLPRTLGTTTQGDPLVVSLGRFGPYIKAGTQTASLPTNISPIELDFARAQTVLAESVERKKKMQEPIAILGNDPVSGKPILVKEGRFGPYVTDGTTNMSIRKSIDPKTVTHEMATEMLEKKRHAPKRPNRFRKKREA